MAALVLPGVEQHVEILDAEMQRFPAIGQQEGGSRVDAGGGTGAHLRIDLLEAEFDIDVIRAVRVPDDLDGQAVGEGPGLEGSDAHGLVGGGRVGHEEHQDIGAAGLMQRAADASGLFGGGEHGDEGVQLPFHLLRLMGKSPAAELVPVDGDAVPGEVLEELVREVVALADEFGRGQILSGQGGGPVARRGGQDGGIEAVLYLLPGGGHVEGLAFGRGQAQALGHETARFGHAHLAETGRVVEKGIELVAFRSLDQSVQDVHEQEFVAGTQARVGLLGKLTAQDMQGGAAAQGTAGRVVGTITGIDAGGQLRREGLLFLYELLEELMFVLAQGLQIAEAQHPACGACRQDADQTGFRPALDAGTQHAVRLCDGGVHGPGIGIEVPLQSGGGGLGRRQGAQELARIQYGVAYGLRHGGVHGPGGVQDLVLQDALGLPGHGRGVFHGIQGRHEIVDDLVGHRGGFRQGGLVHVVAVVQAAGTELVMDGLDQDIAGGGADAANEALDPHGGVQTGHEAVGALAADLLRHGRDTGLGFLQCLHADALAKGVQAFGRCQRMVGAPGPGFQIAQDGVPVAPELFRRGRRQAEALPPRGRLRFQIRGRAVGMGGAELLELVPGVDEPGLQTGLVFRRLDTDDVLQHPGRVTSAQGTTGSQLAFQALSGDVREAVAQIVGLPDGIDDPGHDVTVGLGCRVAVARAYPAGDAASQ